MVPETRDELFSEAEPSSNFVDLELGTREEASVGAASLGGVSAKATVVWVDGAGSEILELSLVQDKTDIITTAAINHGIFIEKNLLINKEIV